jgi:hypothetical protein
VITVEAGSAVGADAPSVEIVRGSDRAATVTLRGDVDVSRNGRRSRPDRVRVGDRIRVGTGSVTVVDPWHA